MENQLESHPHFNRCSSGTTQRRAVAMTDDKPPIISAYSNDANIYKALKQSEERYQELVSHANSIIMHWDLDGHISFFNEYAQHFFGYKEKDILGSNMIGTIIPKAPNTDFSLKTLVSNICKSPENYEYNINENVTKSGRHVWVAWTNKVILDDDGGITGILSIGTDITRQKSLEEELKQSYKMKAIGELAGGIAHDFNNMIHGIIGYAQIIMGTDEAADQRDHAEQILTTARHASDLTKQLLTFAQKGPYELEICDLHELAQDTIKILEHTIDRKIHINNELRANKHMVMGDAAQLKSALLNLALNAKDAMPDGGIITFKSENVHFASSASYINDFRLGAGSYIVVKVEDNGHGMSPKVVDRVFDPFFTTKIKGRGTGMGLAAVHGTVHLHKGAVNCKSQVGKGTSFSLFLPLAEEVKEVNSPNIAAPYSIHPVSVMLIDDEPIVRTYTKTLFEQKGHRVITFEDAEEGVEYYRTHFHEIDIVVIDMIMPKLNGEETFSLLKQVNPDVKAILASGYSSDENIQKVKAAGIADCIQKPFTLEQFEWKIKDLI